ncbi:MAG: hypothetical protein R2911_33895 [Caldilineaceae bacterium]
MRIDEQMPSHAAYMGLLPGLGFELRVGMRADYALLDELTARSAVRHRRSAV